MHRVVIVGGGFGGLYAAYELDHPRIRVTLVDRRNFHLFQPLLYQVATGSLSPANIAMPLRSLLARRENTRVLLAEARGLDTAGRRLLLAEGEIQYDTLIVAAGATHHYFGNDHWARTAPGLKTVEDATEIRRRVLLAFEQAELETHPARIPEWLTFVVVGGGPTGVEMAGALAEMARHTLRRDFRDVDTAKARILLVEAGDRVLAAFPPPLSDYARQRLEQDGVQVLTETTVLDVSPASVTVRRQGREETLAARTVVWAAGVQASPLGKAIAEAAGAQLDRAGRVIVGPDLSVPGHPEVFVIGDLARFEQDGKPLPGLAPVAIQQGQHAAQLVRERLAGRSLPPFRYRDKGTMATIGRAAAVVDLGRFHLTGFIAWVFWLFLHLMYIVIFENRVLILTQWAWAYVTRNRSARLITGSELLPARTRADSPQHSNDSTPRA